MLANASSTYPQCTLCANIPTVRAVLMTLPVFASVRTVTNVSYLFFFLLVGAKLTLLCVFFLSRQQIFVRDSDDICAE